MLYNIDEVVKDSDIDLKSGKNEIEDIILVGEASRMPAVKKFVSEKFDNK